MDWMEPILKAYGLAGICIVVLALVIRELFKLLVASYKDRNDEAKLTVAALKDSTAAIDRQTASIDALTRTLERKAA